MAIHSPTIEPNIMPPRATPPTRRVRATTVELRRAQLGHAIALFGARRVRDIGELDIARLRRALARYKPRTANGILAAVSACLKLAARFGYRGPVPEIERVRMAETMEESPEGRACSPEEFAVMLGAARHLGPAELATVLLAGDAGLRAGEIGALRWDDVDFRRGSIRVARTVVRLKGARTEHPTKGGRIRRVPASPRLLAALRELAEVPAADGYVLHDRQGALATGRTVEGTLRRVERRAKIRTFGPHASAPPLRLRRGGGRRGPGYAPAPARAQLDLDHGDLCPVGGAGGQGGDRPPGPAQGDLLPRLEQIWYRPERMRSDRSKRAKPLGLSRPVENPES